MAAASLKACRASSGRPPSISSTPLLTWALALYLCRGVTGHATFVVGLTVGRLLLRGGAHLNADVARSASAH